MTRPLLNFPSFQHSSTSLPRLPANHSGHEATCPPGRPAWRALRGGRGPPKSEHSGLGGVGKQTIRGRALCHHSRLLLLRGKGPIYSTGEGALAPSCNFLVSIMVATHGASMLKKTIMKSDSTTNPDASENDNIS